MRFAAEVDGERVESLAAWQWKVEAADTFHSAAERGRALSLLLLPPLPPLPLLVLLVSHHVHVAVVPAVVATSPGGFLPTVVVPRKPAPTTGIGAVTILDNATMTMTMRVTMQVTMTMDRMRVIEACHSIGCDRLDRRPPSQRDLGNHDLEGN